MCYVFLIILVERQGLGRLDLVIGLSASLIVEFVKRVAVLICDSPKTRDTCFCIAAKLTPLIRYLSLRCYHSIAKVNVSLGNAVFADQDLELLRENIGQV